MPRARHPGAAARRQRERAALHGGAARGVRFGLTAIKNVGEGAIAVDAVVRQALGRITSLHELCEELDLRLANKRVFESLVKAGAFDSRRAGVAALPRLLAARLMRSIDVAFEHGARAAARHERRAGELFGVLAATRRRPVRPRRCRCRRRQRWTEQEQLAFEKETLGLYWSGHPTDCYAAELSEFGARTTTELMEMEPRPQQNEWGPGGRKLMEADMSIGGVIATARQLKTKKGDRMAVFTLEDATAAIEVVCFPEAFSQGAAAD
ncbi:MAG: hypothetical protein QM736_07940 [Vicinamibacterales bacterium]